MLPLTIRVMDKETQTTKEYCFSRSPVRIGRNTLNDLSLQRSFVSLFHAVLHFDEEGLHLVDLGSTNGTAVDGARVAKNTPVRMEPGTTVDIGQLSLSFSRGDSVQAREQASSMTQFRKLSSLRAQLGEELAPSEPLSFSPTPVQDRPSATTRLQRLSPRPTRAPEETEEESPPTVLMSAPDLHMLAATAKSAASSAPPRKRTLTGSSRNVVADVPRQTVGDKLAPLYDRYREAWGALHAELTANMEPLTRKERLAMLSQLHERMPALAQEEQFQALASEQGLEVRPPNSNRLDVVSRELLEQFVRSYLPQARGLESEQDVDRFLERLAEVLETCGRAFVELRQGQEQFGQQMAVHVASEITPLHRAKNTREVMQYLLDWRVAGEGRLHELMSGFVDVMIHQVALLNGMREGVRGLLQQLSPEVLEQTVGRTRIKLGPLSIPAGLWPFRRARRWAEYVERHRAFLEEERELTAALFGPEFAKAYLAIVGDTTRKGAGAGAPTSEREERGVR